MTPPPPPSPLQPTIYEGTFISAPALTTLEILPHARIGVSSTGHIAFIHSSLPFPPLPPPFSPSTPIIRTSPSLNQFFFPGFVDTHAHPPQHPNLGLLTPSLLTWLSTYTYPLESRLSQPSSLPFAQRIFTRHIRRSLAHGTTTAAYYATASSATTNLLSTQCHALGQRALVGRVNMDRPSTTPHDYRDQSVAQALADTQATIAHARALHPLVTPVITPRFAPSCSAALLAALGDLAASEHLPVQTHLAESKAELRLVEELFPDETNYTAVYDAHGLLTGRTVLAHCVHLSAEEVALIRDRRAGVSHCPTSNLALGSGVARVRELLDAGVKVGLGTDVSGGWAVGMLEVCRVAIGCSALLVAEAGEDRVRLGVGEVLFLATWGGAEVLGLWEQGVGGFEVGGWWDAQLVELGGIVGGEGDDTGGNGGGGGGLGNVDVWEGQSWEEKVGKWVWGGDERNTRRVWVGGREVHRVRNSPDALI